MDTQSGSIHLNVLPESQAVGSVLVGFIEVVAAHWVAVSRVASGSGSDSKLREALDRILAHAHLFCAADATPNSMLGEELVADRIRILLRCFHRSQALADFAAELADARSDEERHATRRRFARPLEAWVESTGPSRLSVFSEGTVRWPPERMSRLLSWWSIGLRSLGPAKTSMTRLLIVSFDISLPRIRSPPCDRSTLTSSLLRLATRATRVRAPTAFPIVSGRLPAFLGCGSSAAPTRTSCGALPRRPSSTGAWSYTFRRTWALRPPACLKSLRERSDLSPCRSLLTNSSRRP